MKFIALVIGSVLGVLLLTTQSSFATLNSAQRVSDFTQLVNIIERNYGPLHLKQRTIQLNFNKAVEDYKSKIAAARTDAEFYQLLSRFLAELKDAHVSPLVPSTYKASLGFAVDRVEGKVLIEAIDALKLPDVLFPFKKGDQLISLGGVPVENIVEELNQQSNSGNAETSLRLATGHLTSRQESAGFAVPKGVVTVTVLPKGAALPITATATWILSGVPAAGLDDLENLHDDDLGVMVNVAASNIDLFHQLKHLPMFNAAISKSMLADMQMIGMGDVGNPKSMFALPEGAQEIPKSSVTAAIYEAAGKKIGILRIPQYLDESLLETFTSVLLVMEQETDALVLDQTNNPGGSATFVSSVVSLFADKSYTDMKYKLRPSMSWIKQFDDANAKVAAALAADPTDQEGNALQARFAFLSEEVRDAIAEKRFLTTPISLDLMGTYGIIQPSPGAHYSKPILLLINELDFSGGDAFPAIMKDNGRATLFGAKTNGAGGNVGQYGPLANSFFKFNLTESLMVRPNGTYIENQGVKPDIAYAITEDDFMNGYRGYVKAFTVEAAKLAGASAADIAAYAAK